MPNTKKDTTKRKRDKSTLYWVLGLMVIAVILLFIGRLGTETLEQDAPTTQIDIDQDSFEIESEPTGLDITTDELESATGSTIPELE